MEISLQQNASILKNVTYIYKSKSTRSGSFKVNTISCRVKESVNTRKEKANLYELLSLSSSDHVGFEEIKKAYRSKALEYHPDVCADHSNRAESTQRFVEIRKAYDVLSDPALRRMYDFEMNLIGGGRHCYYEDERGRFCKKVWERQLSGLKQRSLDKLEKKKNGSL